MANDMVKYNLLEEEIIELYTKGMTRQDIALKFILSFSN
jgi:hypothetical protein